MHLISVLDLKSILCASDRERSSVGTRSHGSRGRRRRKNFNISRGWVSDSGVEKMRLEKRPFKVSSIKKSVRLPSSSSQFLFCDRKSSRAHTTLSPYLQLLSGCCFPSSRAVPSSLPPSLPTPPPSFSLFLIHLAVRHSAIRQNEDFLHNQAHAKSDIIQSGPFSSAFVLCFLPLFWTFLWFQ